MDFLPVAAAFPNEIALMHFFAERLPD